MRFTKMTGAGNDFIILAAQDSAPVREASGAVHVGTVRKLCDRRYGIGADGLMIVTFPSSGQADCPGLVPSFSVDFFNSDGSAGMLCGNGARCTLEYSALTGAITRTDRVLFRFAGKTYSGTSIAPGLARLDLPDGYRMESLTLSTPFPCPLPCHRVDVGSLHCVVDIEALRRAGVTGEEAPSGEETQDRLEHHTLDLAALGPVLRNHPDFAPAGVNVNVCELQGGMLHVRTFERGVEAETLACGTGSVSSALVYWSLGRITPPVRVRTRSGEILVIDFVPDGNRAEGISLSGPARRVFEGDIEVRSLD